MKVLVCDTMLLQDSGRIIGNQQILARPEAECSDQQQFTDRSTGIWGRGFPPASATYLLGVQELLGRFLAE